MAEYAVAAAGRTHRVRVEDDGDALRVAVDGRTHRVRLDRWLGSTHFRCTCDEAVQPVAIRRRGDDVLVTVGMEQYRLRVGPAVPITRRTAGPGAAGARDVTAPMPGLVVSVEVAEGDRVEQGRAVAVIEAMKMQSELRAPLGGTVTAVRVRPGQEVGAGAVLITVTAGENELRDQG